MILCLKPKRWYSAVFSPLMELVLMKRLSADGDSHDGAATPFFCTSTPFPFFHQRREGDVMRFGVCCEWDSGLMNSLQQ